MAVRSSRSAALVFVVFGLVTGAFGQGAPGETGISLVESGRSCCSIVYPEECPLSARTARKVAEYLQQQTDARVPVFAGKEFKAAEQNTAVIVLDGTHSHRLAGRWGTQAAFSSDRQDAYRLKAIRREGLSGLVLALGKGAPGAKYAAYRLMRELEINGRNARIRCLDVQTEPFIKTRSVALFNVWGMPIELTRRHNTESWPIQDLERYIDMYDFFGFNAIESHDRFNDNYLEPLFGIKRAQWREKVQRMCDFAHANGQEFFLRIWGHVVMENPKLAKPLGPNGSVPKKLKYLCPGDPGERKVWEEEIRDYYVSNYAGRIDQLIGHWCDPGVCRRNGCTFETPMRLQMELHKAFKEHDPRFNSTFNLWFFEVTKDNPARWARGGWAGYTTDRDMINTGLLGKEVMIATATSGSPEGTSEGSAAQGKYNDSIVRAILAAGHKPALWTWYRADHEIRPSLHIHLHEHLGEYFKGLPPSARQLEWHNIERNVHGAANTANYYVAGRLMWEPTLNPDDLLSEFLTLAFGAENARRITPAYAAIENLRCCSCSMNRDNSRFRGIGTANPEQDAQIARAALAKLAEVKLDPNYRPRVPLDLSPAQIIADLTASLEVIRDFAECRARELPAIEKTLSANQRQEAAKLLDGLEAKYRPCSLTLAGRQEWGALDGRIKELRKRLRN